MEDLHSEKYPDLHRYCSPTGLPELRKALAKSYQTPVERMMITAGATGALHCMALTLLKPGAEVLILAPYWPLIAGIVRTAHGQPISVPFFGEQGSIAERIESYITDKTVAIYVNSPNNPTGHALSAQDAADVAGLARKHGLWIWSDEVYEQLQYHGVPVSMRDLAPERCFSVFSFSKVYGMAGHRCGYLIGPEQPGIMEELRKAVIHAFYSTPVAAQLAGLKALSQGDEWLRQAKSSYYQASVDTAKSLGVAEPDGSTFFFLDVGAFLDERGLDGFLVDCIDQGLLLAPGPSFGAQYQQHVRICYTCVAPEKVAKGVAILQQLFEEKSA